MANDYARMQQLTARALQGQRWDSLTIDPTVDPLPSPPA